MPRRSALVTVMLRAAEKVGRALIRDFGEVEQLQVSRKGPADFGSTADIKADRMLREELSKARPQFGFLTEEGEDVDAAPGEARWIIDPIDGTTNFLHGLPHWAISIAAEQDGEIIAGVVHDPIKDETFWAERNIGAFMNSRRLRVSGRSDLSTCLLATGVPFLGSGTDPERFKRQLDIAMAHTAGVRRYGSAALDLAYVAAGRYDGYWEEGLSPWDIAAGILLVREAGGFVSGLFDEQNPVYADSILAANGAIHAPILKLMQEAGRD